MGITVKEALSIAPLDCCGLVAGINGMDRVIEGLTVIEAPDSPRWLKGGELALTIGYMYKENPDLWCQLIEELDQVGASGLGVKFNRFISDLPLAAKLKADQLGFPVLEIPYNLGWKDIFNKLYKYLLDEETMKKHHAHEVSAWFMGALLNNQPLSSLLEILCRLINYPVAIIDTRGHKLATACPPPASLNNKCSPDESPDNAPVTYLLSSPNGRIAYLAVYPSAQLTLLDTISIEQAVNAISLYLAKEQAVREVERRYRTQFITGIINGHFDSVNNLIERARGFGWDFSMPHVVALLEVDFFSRSHKTSYGSQGYQQQKEQALEITKNGFRKYYVGGQPVVVDYGRHILVLILDKDATSIPKYVLKKTKATIKQVIEDLKFSMSCLTVSAGISRIQKSITDLGTGYKEAEQALLFLQTMRHHDSVIAFDDLGVHRLLSSVSERELRDFVKGYLEPLIRNDKNQDRIDSLKTLRTYLQHGGVINRSAETLFIDRRTMRYRLNKIEAMLDLDLKDPVNMLNISVALLALDILQDDERV